MTTSPVPRSLVVALALPAILGAVFVIGVEMWRIGFPRRAEVGHRVYGSLGEAIALDDVRGAYGFIRRGHDPNELIPVRDRRLTGDREVLVSPVRWAAATGRRTIVLMLLQAGATLIRDADAMTPCVAERLGYRDIASDVRVLGGLTDLVCQPADPDAPPLSGPATGP